MAVATSGKPAGWLAAAFRVVFLFARFFHRHFANLLTIARLGAIIPLIWTIGLGYFEMALQIFVLAALSDALDGWYAKATNTCSHLGALLDPIADKLMVTACLLALGAVGSLPYWFAGVVLARELLIGVGYLLLRWRLEAWVAVSPSIVGKLATVLELTLIGLALTHLVTGLQLTAMIFALSAATGAALVLASAQYANGFIHLWRRPVGGVPSGVLPS